MHAAVQIKHVPRTLTRRLIELAFSRFGQIKKIKMPSKAVKYAVIEFLNENSANNSIAQMDGTQLAGIHSRKKAIRNGPCEFVWDLARYNPSEFLWEGDADTTEIEKEILKKKKKNLLYVESIDGKIRHAKGARQRPIIDE
ncbi:hypothetical protein NEAUS06_1244 [Nematocida ausubeli]|nr:hypothetical protein NEAUS06_1244 [Nematocida ausubeli]